MFTLARGKRTVSAPITDNVDGRIFGDCSLEHAEESGELELSYSVGKDHWGQGIATEATRALVRFGLEELALERIAGIVSVDNLASCRVLEHLGFLYERDADLYGFDALCYAVSSESFINQDSVYLVSL